MSQIAVYIDVVKHSQQLSLAEDGRGGYCIRVGDTCSAGLDSFEHIRANRWVVYISTDRDASKDDCNVEGEGVAHCVLWS